MSSTLALLLVAVPGCFVAVLVGSPVTGFVLRRAGDDPGGARRSGEPPILAAADTLRGGRAIGMLERLSTYVALLSGYPEAVALVVAIKGLGRYGELKSGTEGAAERFIIGTLTSLLFAGLCALASRWVIDLTTGRLGPI